MSKRLTIKEIYTIRKEFLQKHHPYSLTYWSEYDYSILTNTILYRKKAGRGSNKTYNDIIIMCDTETSKKRVNTTYFEDKEVSDKNGFCSVIKMEKYNPVECHVVAWTISLRAFNMNIVTLYGQKPSDFCECLSLIQNALNGDETFMYWHNMSYDWVYIRKFMFAKFGHPSQQLNTKPHFPIVIRWDDYGIIFKDSLILAQRKLEKWAQDLNVPHQKAVGKWDYNKIRTQHDILTADELTYIENDTLAGVECLDYTMQTLKKKIYSMPFTATGIPREECRKIGKQNNVREMFLSMVLEYEHYIQAERTYHGGYTHANRYLIERIVHDVICFDFSSSYPAVMMMEKYPMERFSEYHDCSMDEILSQSEDYAFMCKLIMFNPRLKDAHNPMPSLQYSKACGEGCSCINPVIDNGRILEADYVAIYLTDVDLEIINEQYECEGGHICCEVLVAEKGYLPRWFTDYAYKLYYDKCVLKNGDPVLYNIQKAKLNSLYGMCVMKALRDNLVENYVNGEYDKIPLIDLDTDEPYTSEELYSKYVDNNNSFLPYQWGIYITCFAMKNLFTLAKCCIDKDGVNHFCYSDTDSVYSTYWDEEKVKEYNLQVLHKLRNNNYEPVEYDSNTYTPGVAEFDGSYSEFRVLGAKRYSCRYSYDSRNKEKNRGKLKITVAGVPKCGVDELNDDINNFTSTFIFKGVNNGKLTHHYIVSDEIYIDDKGNETADCVDLTPCDYLLSSIDVVNIDDLFTDEVEIQVYDE